MVLVNLMNPLLGFFWLGVSAVCLLLLWLEDLWNAMKVKSLMAFLLEEKLLQDYEDWRVVKNSKTLFKRW